MLRNEYRSRCARRADRKIGGARHQQLNIITLTNQKRPSPTQVRAFSLPKHHCERHKWKKIAKHPADNEFPAQKVALRQEKIALR